jgi:hypothetical protein
MAETEWFSRLFTKHRVDLRALAPKTALPKKGLEIKGISNDPKRGESRHQALPPMGINHYISRQFCKKLLAQEQKHEQD